MAVQNYSIGVVYSYWEWVPSESMALLSQLPEQTYKEQT